MRKIFWQRVVIDGVKELDLIRKAQIGNEEALNTLIGEYYQPVFAYFYKNTNHYHRSKDLTQEVFIKMVASISKYKPTAPFKSWIFTIASNHLKNHYRTSSRHPECLELPEDIPAIDASVEKIGMAEDIQTALEHLPPKQKEAIILRYYYDFSIKEIAKITSTIEPTVKARIRYSLEKLKKELEGYDEQ